MVCVCKDLQGFLKLKSSKIKILLLSFLKAERLSINNLTFKTVKRTCWEFLIFCCFMIQLFQQQTSLLLQGKFQVEFRSSNFHLDFFFAQEKTSFQELFLAQLHCFSKQFLKTFLMWGFPWKETRKLVQQESGRKKFARGLVGRGRKMILVCSNMLFLLSVGWRQPQKARRCKMQFLLFSVAVKKFLILIFLSSIFQQSPKWKIDWNQTKNILQNANEQHDFHNKTNVDIFFCSM